MQSKPLTESEILCQRSIISSTLNCLTPMTTTIQYKTLTFSQNTFRNTQTLSKAESVYSPNVFDEDLSTLIKPATTLADIQQTIFEEKIIWSLKKSNPLYSSVLFLN